MGTQAAPPSSALGASSLCQVLALLQGCYPECSEIPNFSPVFFRFSDVHFSPIVKGMTVIEDTATPYVVALGTAGGPRWWDSPGGVRRKGISTAIVVGDSVYLVDLGRDSASQLAEAGIRPAQVRGIFLTHLHSDHTVDLASHVLFGWVSTPARPYGRLQIHGPGDRGALPPSNRNAAGPVGPVFADTPTAGTEAMFEHLLRAYSADTTDRIMDSLRPDPYGAFDVHDIVIPEGVGYHPNDNPTPEGMEPFEVYSDENVIVTAILVQHPPVAPAFAFRFDTAHGSVTISGDTAACGNTVRLAKDTDLLMHEAIDFDWVAKGYGDEAPATAAATIEHHRKSHTSAEDAGRVAEAAGAKSLALHHLVPPHADPSVWHAANRTFSGDLLVPNDLDCISFSSMPGSSTHTFEREGTQR